LKRYVQAFKLWQLVHNMVLFTDPFHYHSELKIK